MKSVSPNSEEVRQLADRLYDGRGDAVSISRLDDLLRTDSACLQAYVEQVNFHNALLQLAEGNSPEDAAVSVLKDFSRAVRILDRRDRTLWSMALSGLAVAVLLLVGILVAQLRTPLSTEAIGSIASLSGHVQGDSAAFEVGRVIRAGDLLTVRQGMLGLALRHAHVTVIGPASLRLDRHGQVTLQSGTIAARVRPSGRGFTVRTPNAEVVDLGTEFSVHFDAQRGTDVHVLQGHVQARPLDSSGNTTQVLDLVANQGALIPLNSVVVREIDFQADAFETINQGLGRIARVDGQFLVTTSPPPSLQEGRTTTRNHALIIPEQQGFILSQELTVQTADGPLRIPAGSAVSSYLIHYDPPADLSQVPRGTIQFFDPVSGIITDASQLAATDFLATSSRTVFDPGPFRGMELRANEDKAKISNNRRSAQFRFDISSSNTLDEARVLIVERPKASHAKP